MEEGRVRSGWRGVIRRYDAVLSTVEGVFVVAAAVLLFAMILMVSYSVLGRKFFGLSGAWAVELSEYIMLYLTFLVAPWVLKHDGHVRVDVLLSRLGPRSNLLADVITTIVATVACLVLFWFSLGVTVESYQRGVTLMKILQVPEYLLLAVIPLGSLLLSLRLVCRLLQRFAGEREDESASETQLPDV